MKNQEINPLFISLKQFRPKQTPLWLLNTEIIEQQQQQQAFTEPRYDEF